MEEAGARELSFEDVIMEQDVIELLKAYVGTGGAARVAVGLGGCLCSNRSRTLSRLSRVTTRA
jgi:hypothetical protein